MDDILNKIKELTAQCEALQDPKTIEMIIKAQTNHIREQYMDLIKEKDRFMDSLAIVEKQMIQHYGTKKDK